MAWRWQCVRLVFPSDSKEEKTGEFESLESLFKWLPSITFKRSRWFSKPSVLFEELSITISNLHMYHDHYRYSYLYLQATSVYSGDSDAAHSDMEDSWMSQILWNSLFCGQDFFSWKYHSVTFHDEGLGVRVVCWSCQVQKQSGKICFVLQSLIYHNFPFPHSRLLFVLSILSSLTPQNNFIPTKTYRFWSRFSHGDLRKITMGWFNSISIFSVIFHWPIMVFIALKNNIPNGFISCFVLFFL